MVETLRVRSQGPFAHDTAAGLQAAAALVNTDDPDGEQLPDLASLDRFLDEWGWTGRRRRTRRELDEIRALRTPLRRLWQLDEDAVVAQVNAMLRAARALPQLVRHDDRDYHLHATPPGARLVDRMAVEAAMAFVDVVRQNELGRLRICEAEDCEGVVVDLSKNRSRLYCSTTCSNRVNVAAFRARQR
ncbi:MAG TPA: CGNR zinc finger domain-containing protein [Candidatus Angelobacter sp.]|jgi:predicted RNA-binding Zn ribbon-like protein|nr:CGNR zinc finger domain-containing protein [Candidatus Angelobacter sp.]